MRKMARHVISQLLYLQMIMLMVDSEYARYILSLHTAGLCYKQALYNCIYEGHPIKNETFAIAQ